MLSHEGKDSADFRQSLEFEIDNADIKFGSVKEPSTITDGPRKMTIHEDMMIRRPSKNPIQNPPKPPVKAPFNPPIISDSTDLKDIARATTSVQINEAMQRLISRRQERSNLQGAMRK